jgi:acetylornithine/succinyldiaminopimelate/putrescine aminotransferase
MLQHVRDDGAWFGTELRAMANASPKVRAVRGVGFIWGIDTTDAAKDVIARAYELGLLVCSAGEHTIRLLPPLVMTRADLERGLKRLAQAIG